jgi:hypothetical protein
MLDAMEVVRLLRNHAPPGRQATVDRLETALRLLARIERELTAAEVMCAMGEALIGRRRNEP